MKLRTRAARAEARDPQRAFTEEQKAELWKQQKGKCAQCRLPLVPEPYLVRSCGVRGIHHELDSLVALDQPRFRLGSSRSSRRAPVDVVIIRHSSRACSAVARRLIWLLRRFRRRFRRGGALRALKHGSPSAAAHRSPPSSCRLWHAVRGDGLEIEP